MNKKELKTLIGKDDLVFRIKKLADEINSFLCGKIW